MSAESFTKMAPFERKVAKAIREGKDPYFGWKMTSNSRVYSQAISRLWRKGFVVDGKLALELTVTGIAQLDQVDTKKAREIHAQLYPGT